MKNYFKKYILVLILSLFFVGNSTFAEGEIIDTPLSEVSVHLNIISGGNSFYDSDISVTSCDSDNAGTLKITAYCAVLQSGVPSVWDWSWAPGAFVTSVGGVDGYTTKDKDNNDVYHYWSWSLNGAEAMMGLNQYELRPNDSVLLEFIDPIEEIIPEVTLKKESHGSSGSIVGSYTNTDIEEKVFSTPDALDFLSVQQKEDGSFGYPLYTDWVAIGVSKAGSEAESLKNKISNYYKKDEFKSDVVTDYERHAMALMAQGINPYNGTGINYIKKITDSFDGTQIGDASIIGDDIFGLIVLSHAGYKKDDEIISKVVSFIISHQSSYGAWESVDMTSATIEALKNFEIIDSVPEAISKGELYLKKEQKSDGSWGNSFSTSWVMQVLSSDNSFDKEIKNATSYLAGEQEEDGGLGKGEMSNRVWATAYAIPAVMGLSWNNVLGSFPREEFEIIPIVREPSLVASPVKIIVPNNKVISKMIQKDESRNNSLPASVGNIIEYKEEKTSLVKRVFNNFWGWLISLL
jgi:hypothetical protein